MQFSNKCNACCVRKNLILAMQWFYVNGIKIKFSVFVLHLKFNWKINFSPIKFQNLEMVETSKIFAISFRIVNVELYEIVH